MANNRLFLVDLESREMIMLAKSMGAGWYCLDNIKEKLTEFFDNKDLGIPRDQQSSCNDKDCSMLCLKTEGEIAPDIWEKYMKKENNGN